MSHSHSHARPETHWQAIAWRAGVCLVASIAGYWAHEANHAVSTACYMIAYLFGGWDVARETWADLRHWRFDTHFLMLMVVPGSVAVGAWGEAAFLLFLFSTSSAMEAFASDRTHREISALLRSAPKTARLITEDGESTVEVEAIRPGQILRVLAGELVPVDMRVTEGESACDESNLTGEAEPIHKSRGDLMLAGTLNLWGVIDARVERSAEDSSLQRIIRLIETAQHLKSPTQRFTDRFGTSYTAFVMGACLLLFLILWRGQGYPAFVEAGGQPSAFYRAMTLLVVMSPCALVLSVPSAILSAIAFGARHGVLFRGGAAIENLAEITLVAMDKTGTLTDGNLHVSKIEALHGSEEAVFAAAANLSRLSNHPVSRSIAREAARRGVAVEEPQQVETIPGKGLRARWQNHSIALGNRELISGMLPPTRFASLPPQPENASETWVAGEGLLGRLILRDELRAESRGLVDRLRRDGLRTAMLTGDRGGAATRIGRESGIDEILSQLRPEQKVEALEQFRRQGHRVAMIGDGVNDAPCLAAADVGVAMGARGSDAAIEQAEVVLMNDRLENFILARELSVRSRRIIRQNLAISLGTILVMIGVTLFDRSLPLSVGVAMHEGSTVVVVLNSLRLLLEPGRRAR